MRVRPRFPVALRFVIVVNDGHGGQNMARFGWPVNGSRRDRHGGPEITKDRLSINRPEDHIVPIASTLIGRWRQRDTAALPLVHAREPCVADHSANRASERSAKLQFEISTSRHRM
jgi:hypothetical protein